MNEAAASSRSLRFLAGKGNALSSALHDRLQCCCCSALKARLDVVRKKFSRKQLLQFTANLKVELIGMEACGGSHFQGRALCEQGHEVRLMPAQDVKPYVKTNKSDYIDAEAIAEAVRAAEDALRTDQER
jgi:transposase